MSDQRITCLVPTHQRPQFLRRLLRFYCEFPPGYPIVVADSSDAQPAAENARAVAEAKAAGLEVEYRHYALDIIDKCRVALEETPSPFVTFCADDDVLFPDAVRQCVDFLERNPGYVSAQGRTAMLYPGRRRFACVRLKGFDVADDDPFRRCQRLADSFFSNFYSVYQREDLTRNFRIVAANTDSRSIQTYTMPEMLLSQLSLVRGRLKVLPTMHLLMERHPTNASYLARAGERQQAEELYQRFKNCLVTELAGVGVDQTAAAEYVDRSFGYFRETSLKHRARKRSFAEKLTRLFRSLVERAEDSLHCDQARHRRLLRRGDIAGSEAIWDGAVKLMREYPDGIPADGSAANRVS